jgi:hypothetical protein
MDRIIAFDYYNRSEPGRYYHDCLVCYRPGIGQVHMLEKRREGGEVHFISSFKSNTGIGTYDLMNFSDQILAFDYKDDIAGKMAARSSGPSELFLFRPGSGVASIAQSKSTVQFGMSWDPVFIPAYWYSVPPEHLREPRRADLSALASAPEASGDPFVYLRSGKGDLYYTYVYLGKNNHIYELYLNNVVSGICADLTQSAGAPAASGDLAGYARSDGINAVVYRGTNNHIYELLYLNKIDSWFGTDLTQSAGAPAASGDPAGYVRSDGINAVVYRGTNNHIYELLLRRDGTWHYSDITAVPDAPAHPLDVVFSIASGDPAGYARSDETNSVVYRGTNNAIYELYLEKGASKWICAKLSGPFHK